MICKYTTRPHHSRLPLLMTVEEARKEINHSIAPIYEKGEADNITEIVMEHITRWSRPERILNKEIPLSLTQRNLLAQIILRLQQHEPIQYLINEAWFAGMIFYVDKNVLIPRPETEELLDWIVKDHRQQTTHKKILDIGTGSGCIAITLKNRILNAEIWACDVSDEALNVARMNADALNATIDFVPLDFLDADQRKQLPHTDIIVSNPPYIPQKDKNDMKKNVLEFEPATALFVPDDDSLVFYKAIADFGKEKLNKKGSIYVEIHENIGEQVKNLFQSKNYSSVELRKDLQGKDRMIKATLS
jgi:release factor glutamine methyltransferase